ncbi:MAG: ABC transporter permease, partial [Planctomycetota bacterium]|nr:ABC transporter permease [Planctomycetota bacterium]
SDRLAVLWETVEQDDGKAWRVSPTSYVEWTRQDNNFVSMGLFRAGGWALTGEGDPEILQGLKANQAYFEVLGIEPLLGSVFNAEQDQPGGENVVLLSERVWKRRFASSPDVLGRVITLEGEAFTVVGVMPDTMVPAWPMPGARISFNHEHSQIWLPMQLDMAAPETGRSFICGSIARLGPGVTMEQAQEAMNVVAGRLKASSAAFEGLGVEVKSFRDELVGDLRPSLLILFGSVGLVLFIACVNVANLLLSRSTSRQQEFAVRIALGASRGRVIRQLLVECTMLGLIGGGVGLIMASFGIDLLGRLIPDGSPLTQSIGINGRILLFTLLVSIGTGILFGILPALRISHGSLREKLHSESRGSMPSGGATRIRNALVVSEVALALLMVIGAGLMIQSFRQLEKVDPGFRTDRAVTMDITLPPSQYPEWEQINGFFEELKERIDALPGVLNTTYAYNHPLESNWTGGFRIQGRPTPEPGQSPNGHFRSIGLDYFKTMGIPMLRGRHFAPEDDKDHPGVMIINEALVHRYFPNEDPLGQIVRYTTPYFGWGDAATVEFEVIGIVSDVKFLGVDQETAPGFYLPARQFPLNMMTVIATVETRPEAMMTALRETVWKIDDQLPVQGMSTMADIFWESVAQPRFIMLLMSLFGLIALCLAAVGVYGLISYTVFQRTREIGLRMALGAEQRDVLRLVVRRGLGLALWGIGLGLLVAFILTRVLTSLLFEVTTTDPLTFSLVPALILIIALLAAYLPARRATRIDPMTALRCE